MLKINNIFTKIFNSYKKNKFKNTPIGDKNYPWNETQVIALTKSIQHWYENWENPNNASISSAKCECCITFLNSRINNSNTECEYCPVKIHSGYKYCNNTPWSNCITAGTKSEKQKVYKEEYIYLIEILLGERKPSINKENE